MKTRKKNYL